MRLITIGCWAKVRGARLFAALGLVALCWMSTGCQSPVGTYPMDSSLNVIDSSVRSMPGILREGDVIQISFASSTNLNTVQRIQLDGYISLQFVNRIQAAGQTPMELASALEKLYEPQLRGREQVTVTLVTSATVVYVAGAVLRPGKLPMDRPWTLLEAIMEAGGVDHSRAKLSAVTVLRAEGGRRVARRFNLKHVLEGSDASLFYVKPFDVIYVPEKVINL